MLTRETLNIRLSSGRPFDEVVEAVQAETQGQGFRVLAVHDVQATLAQKGFEREPLKIVEICGARFANAVLNEDLEISTFLPCRIAVAREGDRTSILGQRPTLMAEFFDNPGIRSTAEEVERIVRTICERAAGVTA